MPPLEMAVLLVDDRAQMRMVIRTILQNIGFRNIVEAGDGRAAWNELIMRNQVRGHTGAIGLIIADWMMPNMSGLELLAEVRNDRRFRKLPFVMITAENERDSIVQAIELGVSDYVVKPFPSAVLEAKIRALLNL